MKTTAIAAIILIIIIVAGIGAYAGYNYAQNNQNSTANTNSHSLSHAFANSNSLSQPKCNIHSRRHLLHQPQTPQHLPRHPQLQCLVQQHLRLHQPQASKTQDSKMYPKHTPTEPQAKNDLKDAFQAKYPWITVNFLYYGTGPAIQAAQRGDADMILVHSPSQELPFLTGGYGVDRKIVAYNFFVIIGPASDPAGINGMSNVSQALQKHLQLHAQQPQYSPTFCGSQETMHQEQQPRKFHSGPAAGFNYTQLTTQTSWFKVTGAGMGPTLASRELLWQHRRIHNF